IPFPQMPAAMANKAVEAVQVFQPAASAIEAQGSGKLVVPTGEVCPGFPGEIFVMNPAFGKDQPDVATRVMAAYLRGQRDYWHAFVKKDTPPDEMYEIVAKYTPLKDREVLARALGGLVDPNGEIDPAPLAYSADAFVRYGTATQRIDVNQLIDASWARAAVQRIGRVNPERAGLACTRAQRRSHGGAVLDWTPVGWHRPREPVGLRSQGSAGQFADGAGDFGRRALPGVRDQRGRRGHHSTG